MSVAWVGAAASVVGSVMSADAAEDGLAAQEAGAARSDATQRYMYDTTRADNAPTMQRGNAAGSRLGYLMGLGAGGGAGGSGGYSGTSAPLSRDQLRNQLVGQFTTSGGGIDRSRLTNIQGDPNSILGAVDGNDENLANYGGHTGKVRYWDDQTQSAWAVPQSMMMGGGSTIDEAGLSAAIEARMARQDQEAQAAQAAASSDPAYGSLMRNFSEAAPEFQKFGEAAPEMRKFGEADWKNDFVAQNGIQFGLDEGRKGIERQQSASGGILNGSTLKALARFGVDYGTKNTAGAYDRFNSEQTQGYGRYVDKYNRFNSDQGNQYNRYVDKYNRFNTDQGNTFNRLSGIAGSGQVATNQVGAAGQNYANRVSNTAEGMGNATAAAGIAGSNAISGGLRGAYDNYQTNRLIDGMRGGSSVQKYSGTSYNPYAPNYENSFDRM